MADTTRRSLLTAAVAGVVAGSTPAWAQADLRLRMYWWGSKERAERTEKANQLYQAKHQGVTIAGETLGWGDYWPRLATQVAGRNVADVLQMDYRYIFEYARRGALMPLDEFVPATLHLGDFSPGAVDSGKVDGKIYGISLGLNSTALMYDKGLLQQLGVKEPAWSMSWSEVGDLAVEITKAAKRDGYFGMQDAGRYEPALEVWLRQRGRALYGADGKLGFDEQDAAEWFALWDGLRKRGGAAAPDVQALDMGEIDSSLLTSGKAAIAFANSNQLVGYQALNKSKLAMTMYPGGGAGGKPGQYLKPAMLWSVAARTKNGKPAAEVLDFYANDAEANLILGVERGVPASAAMRHAVEPSLDELGRAQVQYISFITDKVGPLPAPPPAGAGEVQNVLRRVNEQIGFGKSSVKDGASQFVTEAKAILARG
ncbi:MAG TPA: ABC transporter substrate-binding protein [Stellaceae bacterium]|nr:ABC transporter substrate-binding protein [Stellaceae bacterium]